MDRLACVNVVDLPLQILLRRHADWHHEAVAVVDKDTPQGIIRCVNRHARDFQIHAGMPYGRALSLVPTLRAGVVYEGDIKTHAEEIIRVLYHYSPAVEWLSVTNEHYSEGMFLLDASGLAGLYPSLLNWAEVIKEALFSECDFYARIAVGFSRFAVCATACSTEKTGVFETRESERETLYKLALDALNIAPKTQGKLAKLGIQTLAQLVDLPAEGLRRRMGDDVWLLYNKACGIAQKPLTPYRLNSSPEQIRYLDYAETNGIRLLFLIKQLLHPLIVELGRRYEKLVALKIVFVLEDNREMVEALSPAAPTLDELLIIELVRLRLDAMSFSVGVKELELYACGTHTEVKQMHLFEARTRRDMDAANRALARIRAEFGEHAVVEAKICDAHLPEACFEWQPLAKLYAIEPIQDDDTHNAPPYRLIRRIFPKPIRLPSNWLNYPEAPKVCGGPFYISGGWWVKEIRREYYYFETAHHEILWTYYDRRREQWFLQGAVE